MSNKKKNQLRVASLHLFTPGDKASSFLFSPIQAHFTRLYIRNLLNTTIYLRKLTKKTKEKTKTNYVHSPNEEQRYNLI